MRAEDQKRDDRAGDPYGDRERECPVGRMTGNAHRPDDPRCVGEVDRHVPVLGIGPNPEAEEKGRDEDETRDEPPPCVSTREAVHVPEGYDAEAASAPRLVSQLPSSRSACERRSSGVGSTVRSCTTPAGVRPDALQRWRPLASLV